MKKLIIIFVILLSMAHFQLAKAQNFYLHSNGVTCMCPNAAIGDTGTVNGITYTKRTKDEITDQNASTTCTSGITDMSNVFNNSNIIEGDINSWDVSQVTNMQNMFYYCRSSKPIGNWDVSNVTNMQGMFSRSRFNEPIGDWDVSKVTNMRDMFYSSSFNQPIGNWDVGQVTNMKGMFNWTQFNQSIENWNVSNVTNMSLMFSFSAFNQPIQNWDVGKVSNMSAMFYKTIFNQPLGDWDVSNVSDMNTMFADSHFNQPIGGWNVSNVTNMKDMFYEGRFNQDISKWDVSQVTDMSKMFIKSTFNQPIETWDVSKVENMLMMFFDAAFNHPIGTWDVSKVENMIGMFSGSQFNQDISNWNFNPSVVFTSSILGFICRSAFDVENYDLLLQRFSNLNLTFKWFVATHLAYCNAIAHDDLTNNKGWVIMGDTLATTTFTAPADLEVNADAGACYATSVGLGMPAVQCCANHSITNDAPEIFPLDTTVVVWTLTDALGNTFSDDQTITVLAEVDEATICYVSGDEAPNTHNRIFISNRDWNRVAYYEVLRKNSSNVFEPIGMLMPAETSFLDSTADNAMQSYDYRLRTRDVCDGMSVESPTHSTLFLQSSVAADNTVQLSWTKYEGAEDQAISVYRKVNSESFELLATTSSAPNAFSDAQSNVAENSYEYYLAMAAPLCGANMNASTAWIKSNTTTISKTVNKNNFLEINPNPIEHTLHIDLPENITLISGAIYNPLGYKVLTFSEKSVSVAGLAPSAYIVRVSTTYGEATKKFVKF